MSAKFIKRLLPALSVLLVFFSQSAGAQSPFAIHDLRDRAVRAWPLVQALPEEFRAAPNVFLWTCEAASVVKPAVSLEEEQEGRAHEFESRTLAQPLTAYALMIDNSISMNPGWKQAVAALEETYGLLSSQVAAVGVYSFSEEVIALRPTSLARQAGAESSALDLSGLAVIGKDTYLYTALKATINHLASLPVLRREIVLFSDGGAEDRTHYTLGEVTRSAKEAGVVIHTVAFPGQRLKGDTRHVLLQLAGDTGGSYIPHEDRDKDRDKLRNTFRNRPVASAGLVKFDDAKSLPYGQSRLKLKLQQGGTGKAIRYEQVVFIEGVLTFDNVLVTVGRTLGSRNPKRLAAIGVGALLFLVLLAVFVRNRFSARAKRAQEKQEKQTLEIRNEQEEQKEQLAGIAEKLEAVLSQAEKDPEQPLKAFGWLIADSGPVYDLTKASTRIGRSPENEVILPDAYVSNEHAILDFKDGRFIWTDRSPTNSTVINGVRVAGSKAIYPGDHIVCGDTSLHFKLDAMN